MDDRWGAVADTHVGVVGTSSDPFLSMSTCQEHAGASIGSLLMGQALFFSTGACRVSENVQLAGLTCEPIFLSPGISVKMVKYLEFVMETHTSFNSR